jgi:dimethylhistidine N-methyltransferase
MITAWEESPIAHDVREGLVRADKRLPPWLFYDAAGSDLYEQITELPEYYLTRAERSIFETQSDAIVAAVAGMSRDPLHVAELGAGTATKSQILMRAVARRPRDSAPTFLAIDVSSSALDIAAARFAREEPHIAFRPLVAHHEHALDAIRRMGKRQLVLFIGSSIGNFDDDEARRLLRGVSRSLLPGGALLLGTDLRKSASVLVPAYDDAQGVTAAFNLNVLARINRELGGRFRIDRFRHVALWNDAASRIEMHLESLVDQVVRIDALGLHVTFRRGERIHTESSVKYDDAHVDALLGASGFVRERSFRDRDERFALHLARVLR